MLDKCFTLNMLSSDNKDFIIVIIIIMSTFSNDISSEAMKPIFTKFHI